ncbi:hypothetical protein ACEWY4_002874 [Coilia grayii]|uniref:Reverse transcriptase domain-containing protein n=1 Tax=Coilia grayii TaxID=363190 RepID=A0ABD1KPN6_9TELE
MDRAQYILEIESQLANETCYIKLACNPTEKSKQDIDIFLENAYKQGYINQSEHKFLTNDHPIIPVMYALPKVHKTLVNPPGRPIVACSDSLMEPLSLYVDRILRPLVETLPSYLKDTNDFIEQLSKVHIDHTAQDVWLATLDVVSLYTNIPHDKGIAAMTYFLEQRTDTHPPTHFLIEIISKLLHNNFFLFDNNFYLQKQGAAMGSRFSPDYACLFMGFLEERYVFNNNPFLHNIVLWKHFVDDVFCLFLGSREEFDNFATHLNNMVYSIKFNAVVDAKSVSFLDTTVIRQNNILSTTLYTKPTDKNSILHASSAHPPNLKKGLPYTQFLRLKRICTHTADFESELRKMYKQFSLRGYPQTWLNDALEKVRNTDPRPKRDKKFSVACTTTYTAHSHQIKDCIRKHWHILGSDPTCSTLFAEPPLFSHYRAKNVRDFLVRADCHKKTNRDGRLRNITGFFPCRTCAACRNSTKKATSFSCAATGKQFSIKQFTTCNTSNVIYLITCPCNKQYVGKTSRPIKTRIIEHNSAIRRRDDKAPVAQHFMEAGHPLSSLSFTVIEHITHARRGGDLNRRLLQRECFWIWTLNCLHPGGMNEELSLTCFL